MMSIAYPIVASDPAGSDKNNNNSPKLSRGQNNLFASCFAMVISFLVFMLSKLFKTLFQISNSNSCSVCPIPTQGLVENTDPYCDPLSSPESCPLNQCELPPKKQWNFTSYIRPSRIKEYFTTNDREDVVVDEKVSQSITARMMKCISRRTTRDPATIELVLKVTAYLTNILTCETLNQYLGATLQLVTSVASAEMAQYLLQARGFFDTQADNNNALTMLHQYIGNARTLANSFFESPLYGFFYDTLGLLAFAGLCGPELKFGDMQILSAKFTEQAAAVAGKDVLSVLLRAVEFGVEAARDFAGGLPMSKFIFGRSALTFANELLAKYDDFAQGMMEKNHKISDAVYHAQVRSCLVNLKEYVSVSHSTAKSVALATLQRLTRAEADIAARISSVGFRRRPFCVMLAGPSAIGKSTLTSSIIVRTGISFEIPHDPENIASVNETESWDPVTGKTNFVTFDDMCQTTNLKNLTESPLARLVRYNNVTPSMAIKPEANEKNKIPIKPEMILITTNVETLQVKELTRCPDAAFNRIDVKLRVRVKEYCRNPNGSLDRTKVRKGESAQEAAYLDFHVAENGGITTTVGPYRDFEDVIIDICKKMEKHREYQLADEKRFMAGAHVVPCTTCFHLKENCVCVPIESETESASLEEEDEVETIKTLGNTVKPPRVVIVKPTVEAPPKPEPPAGPTNKKSTLDPPTEVYPVEGLMQWISRRFRTEDPDVTNVRGVISFLVYLSEWLPELTERPWSLFENVYTYWATSVFWILLDRLENYLLLTVLILGAVVATIDNIILQAAFIIWIFYTVYSVLTVTRRSATIFVSRVLVDATRDTMGTDLLFDALLLTPLVVTTLFTARSIIKAALGLQAAANQGNLQPKSIAEIEKRNCQKNEWDIKVAPRLDVVCSPTCKTRSSDDTEAAVRKMLYTVEAPGKQPGTRVKCTALRVFSNVILFPKHSFDLMDTSQPVKLIQDQKILGGCFSVLLNLRTVRRINNDHIGVVTAGGMTTTGDIRHLFAEAYTTGEAQFRAVLPHGRSALIMGRTASDIKTAVGTVTGFMGKTNHETLKGDCCSPWIIEGAKRAIVGLHNARLDDTVVAEKILRSDFDVFDQLTFDNQGFEVDIGPPPPLVEIETNYFDTDVFGGEQIDERAAPCFSLVSEDGREPMAEVYCDVSSTRARSNSKVQSTLLSPCLETVGIPQQWGKPRFNPNRNFAASYQQAQHPIAPLPPEALHWAITDYVHPFREFIKELGAIWKPLTLYEVMNGRRTNGQNIKAMNMQTSAGLGLSGTKLDHVEVEETKAGNVYTPKDYVEAEFVRQYEQLKTGHRVAPISKGSLKDEPTKIGKDKVRIFFIMPMAFLMLGRMLICPILCLMAVAPILSEQWYGIKTTTEEWGQCFDYINVFGDQGINGDYKGYDQHFSSQLTWSVGLVFCMLGRMLGYSEEELVALRTWFADISNPIYAFNGTLLSFFGYQPSGNPGTVAINGVGNSLLKRTFFYIYYVKEYGHAPDIGIFRSVVHVGFVGDDSVGGVHKDYPWFNMINYRDWLKSVGMTYTMPDKTSEMVAYLPMKEVTICKRSFRAVQYAAEYDPSGPGTPFTVVHAPIDPDSIMKSWHCLHRPQEGEWLILKNNIVNGLKELSRHPIDVFKYYHEKLLEALALCEHPLIEELQYDYDAWQRITVSYYLDTEPADINAEDDFFNFYSYDATFD